MSFIGGSRSFPVAGAMDDRRHRLRGLSPGDAAMNRGKDDDMQIHLTSSGMYHSAPQMVRLQLVPSGSGKANPPQSQPQASQAKRSVYAKFGAHIEARLWAGLEPELQADLDKEVDRLERLDRPTVGAHVAGPGGGNGAGQQQQGNKPTGQKAVAGAGADSAVFFHITGAETRASGPKVRLSATKETDDVLHQTSSSKDWCGGTPDAGHKFGVVVTVKGPCKNVMGRVP